MADFPEILDEAGDRETMRKRRLTGNSPNEEGPAYVSELVMGF